jgi:hypothetical protein
MNYDFLDFLISWHPHDEDQISAFETGSNNRRKARGGHGIMCAVNHDGRGSGEYLASGGQLNGGQHVLQGLPFKIVA